MKPFVLVGTVLLSVIAMAQQSKSPASDVLREMLGGRERNIVAAFELMPADKFGYRRFHDEMAFGQLAAAFVSRNYLYCSSVGDVARPETEELKGTEDKDKLVASIRASFAFCREALANADDAKMSETITMNGRPCLRAWAFMGLVVMWADHYQAVSMDLRLNGLSPPSAQPHANQ
jgi:hypothetical protein